MDERDIRFVGEAIDIANLSSCKKKHGAIVTKGRRVFGIGWNKDKTHPAIRTQRSYHAEAMAIKHGNGNLKGGTLYSFRNGLNKMSQPCYECTKMAIEHGIKYVVYCTGKEIRKVKL